MTAKRSARHDTRTHTYYCCTYKRTQQQADAAAATVIQAFAGRPILKASAAYNHSSAITSSGRVYTWGSAATGKVRQRRGLDGLCCGIRVVVVVVVVVMVLVVVVVAIMTFVWY